MNHQILIASYAPDFPWLYHNLRSLAKFSSGFLPPVIAVPTVDLAEAWAVIDAAKSDALAKPWDGPGFGRAQDAMMSGDILCPRADYYWLLGSDCLATAPFSPADYCDATGLPIMLYHSWEHMAKNSPETMFWKAGVESALGYSDGEFMRRLPLPYPTKMMTPFREYLAGRHSTRFQPYVWHAVNTTKNFSESNVMGAFAFRNRPPAYKWINLDEGAEVPASPIVQMWSWGGFDRPHDSLQKTPRQIITEALGSF